MKTLKILVVGAGAVGGFYGGKLYQAGCDVHVVCRSEFDVVSKNGFTVTSPLGDFNYRPQVYRSLDAVEESFDVLLITTKVLPSSTVHDDIQHVVNKNTMIVLLQNGIDIEEKFAEKYSDHCLVSGLAFVCLSRVKPGFICHQLIGRLAMGVYPHGVDRRVNELASLFESVQIICKVSESIGYHRWKKMVWNAAFNTISILN